MTTYLILDWFEKLIKCTQLTCNTSNQHMLFPSSGLYFTIFPSTLLRFFQPAYNSLSSNRFIYI